MGLCRGFRRFGLFRLLSGLAQEHAYYSVLDEVMEATPSHKALELAGRFVSPSWGAADKTMSNGSVVSILKI